MYTNEMIHLSTKSVGKYKRSTVKGYRNIENDMSIDELSSERRGQSWKENLMLELGDTLTLVVTRDWMRPRVMCNF